MPQWLNDDGGFDGSAPVKGLEAEIRKDASAVELLQKQLLENIRKGLSEQAESIAKQVDEKFAEYDSKLEKMNKLYSLPGSEGAAQKSPEQKGSFSWARAARSIAAGNDRSLAPLEWEMSDAMHAQRVMLVGTDSAGGFIVPEEQSADIIDRLRAQSVALQAGVQLIPNLFGSPFTIPRLTTSVTANWIDDGGGAGENTSITASDQVFDQLSLSPKTLAARTIVTNLLLENSLPAAETIIRNDMVQQLQLGMDSAILQGTGANGQPTGVVNAAGINVVDFDGGGSPPSVMDYQHLSEFSLKLAEDNALGGSLGWIMAPWVSHELRIIPSQNAAAPAGNIEIARKVLGDAQETMLLGYPYWVTSQLPGSGADVDDAIIFANWAEVFAPQWKTIELRASDVTGDAFEKDNTHIRALMRMDVGVRHPVSICSGTSLAAT